MDVEKIKQKILDLAIRGKLVSQNPDDIPASVLSATIKTEKDKLVKAKKLKASKKESYIFKGSDGLFYESVSGKTTCIQDDIPYNIPSSWTWARLGTICEVRNGTTPRRDNPHFWTNGTVPWFTIEDKHEQGLFINSTKQHITEIAMSPERIVPANSVLLCCTASVGEVAFTNIPLTTNQQFNGLSVRDNYLSFVNPYYLLLFALTLKAALRSKYATATTFGFVSVSKVESFLVPIPPYPEQERIYNSFNAINDKIQLLFNEKIKLKQLCVVLKKKILDSVFSENGSKGFQNQKRETTTLEKLIPQSKIGDGDWVLSDDMDEHGEFKLVQLKHVGDGCYLDKSYNAVNRYFFDSHNCSEIKENYLLINRLISDSMAVCILPKLDFKTITAVDVCWIEPDSNYDQEYLMYYLLSPSFQKEVLIRCSGSTRKRISKKNLIKIKMSIHSFDDQKLIVQYIKHAFALIDSISD